MDKFLNYMRLNGEEEEYYDDDYIDDEEEDSVPAPRRLCLLSHLSVPCSSLL